MAPVDHPVIDLDFSPGDVFPGPVDVVPAVVLQAPGLEVDELVHLEVRGPSLFPRGVPPVPPDEEDLASDGDEEEVQDEEGEWDSGFESLSEEEVPCFPPRNFCPGWALRDSPAAAVDQVCQSPVPVPQQPAETPPSAFFGLWRDFEEVLDFCMDCSTNVSLDCSLDLSLDFPAPRPAPASSLLRRPKRTRDADEEEDPSSKRPRRSFSQDIPDDPTPSTSSGTSGSYPSYYRLPPVYDSDDSD